ncbi:MAG TPA: glycosyltransferase family 39 protein [bacterium]|nr:glycosyltransferase family 39 protein [bacterium]
MRREPLTKTTIVLFCVILVFMLGVNLWFILVDQRPPNGNELSHVMGPIQFLNGLDNPQLSFYDALIGGFSGYPPLGMVTTAFYALFGRTYDVAMISQLFFTAVLMVCIFLLGVRLFDQRTGLLAMVLTAFNPAVNDMARQYLLEHQLGAMLALAVLMIVMSNHFTHRGYSIAAGIAIGLAAWAKQSFVMVLSGAIVGIIPGWLEALWKKHKEIHAAKPLLKLPVRLLVSLVVAGTISVLMYNADTKSVFFDLFPDSKISFDLIFLGGTALCLFITLMLFTGRSHPLTNALGAALITGLIASIWYLPRGIANFLSYSHQMDLNRPETESTLLTCLKFYSVLFRDYYYDKHTLKVVIATMLSFGGFLMVKPLAGFVFNMNKVNARLRSFNFVGWWFFLSYLSFSYVIIYNPKNMIPLLPALSLLLAAMITHLEFPLPKTGITNRFGRVLATFVSYSLNAWRLLLLAGLLVLGFFMVTFWPDGHGGYLSLPGKYGRMTDPHWFKNEPHFYMVPRTADWKLDAIADAMFEGISKKIGENNMVKVLAMDNDHFFSWSNVWYLANLRNVNVSVYTQWGPDESIFDPQSSVYYPTFEYILFRRPYKKIYTFADKNIDYQNLPAAFEFLETNPPELAEKFDVKGVWPMPDGTEAVLLKRKLGLTLPSAP